MNYRFFSRFYSGAKPDFAVSNLFNALKVKIDFSGPITVADYMRHVLTNKGGYYTKRDVFGAEGDFITAPEISQIFGEMLGVWGVNELLKLNSPKPLKIVELGPGRGTMIEDILRVFKKFLHNCDMSVHLVEVSPVLSGIKSKKMCQHSIGTPDSPFFRKGTTHGGIPVYWYNSVKNIPMEGFICLFANEFFDALPVHKFQRSGDSWREVLVDTDPLTHRTTLRYILSSAPTPASLLLTDKNENKNELEICPEAGVIMEHLASRFEEHGGIALVADYSYFGDKGDTFRSFKGHKLHDPLLNPGSADLTADVDFKFLKKSVGDKLITFGPVSQREFLQKLRVQSRLEVLLKNCKDDVERKNLISAIDMLINPRKMGERFKCMSFFPAVLEGFLKKYPVEGF